MVTGSVTLKTNKIKKKSSDQRTYFHLCQLSRYIRLFLLFNTTWEIQSRKSRFKVSVELYNISRNTQFPLNYIYFWNILVHRRNIIMDEEFLELIRQNADDEEVENALEYAEEWADICEEAWEL